MRTFKYFAPTGIWRRLLENPRKVCRQKSVSKTHSSLEPSRHSHKGLNWVAG
jgi:hypothetical protein